MLQEIIGFLARYMVFPLMLSVGLALGRGEVRHALERRGVVLRGLLLVEVLVPLVALVVVLTLQLEPIIEGVILLLAICPGVALGPVVARKPGADIGMVLALLVVASLLAPLTLTIWGAVFASLTPLELVVTPATVMATTAKIIVPLALGAVLRILLPRAAPTLAFVSQILFVVALVALLVVAILRGGPTLLEMGITDVVAMVLIIGTSLLLGHALGGARVADKRALAIFAVLGNPALAIAVAAVSYPDVRAMPWIAAYVLLRTLILLPYMLWTRRHKLAVAVDRATPLAGAAH